jgi:hypothetical protein
MARAQRGQIGPVFRLTDHMSPGAALNPASGAFCVLMPMRGSVSAAAAHQHHDTPVGAEAVAA